MIFVFKILITPLLIWVVTLAGRRWGPAVTGLLVGLPMTSGPISLFLALQYGQGFAARAAAGNLAGQVSMCAFCLVYSLVAQKRGWPASALAAVMAFLEITAIWSSFSWALIPAFIILMVVIGLAAWIIPQGEMPVRAAPVPGWDLPARMLLATAFVVLLTHFANLLGPQLSGLLSPFPVFGLVLAAFTHHQQGPQAAARLLRGVVIGSLAYAGFFLFIGTCLVYLPTLPAYISAFLIAAGVSGMVFYLSRWRAADPGRPNEPGWP